MEQIRRKKKLINRDIVIFIVAFILVICFFLWRFSEHSENKSEIESNYAFTFGIIVKNMREANNSWGVKVKYKVNGVCYVRNYSSTFWCRHNECLSDSIKIEYSTKNPNVSRAVKENQEIIYPYSKIEDQNYKIKCDTVF